MKIKDRYLQRNAAVYRHFGRELTQCDWSKEALVEMHKIESTGGTPSPDNGYFQGKRMMDITVAQWLEDLIEGRILFAWELYLCYPHWFIHSKLPKGQQLTEQQINRRREISGQFYESEQVDFVEAYQFVQAVMK